MATPTPTPKPTPTPSSTPGLADLAAISLASRLPDFWTRQPRVWFMRIEAAMAPQKLGDASKFDLVVSKLGADVIAQITDLLKNPPETGKYEKLKEKLLKIYEESANRQIEQLISEMELGEQKPSQLLRKMRDLARDKVPDETLKVLWQNLLPPTVRAVLAVTETKDLEKLAGAADDVHEVTKSSTIAAVSQSASTSSSSTAYDPIMAEIAKINARFDALETRSSRGRFSRSRYRGHHRRQASSSRNRSTSRRRYPGHPEWLCTYHFRYADKARKCFKPCAWKEKPEN